jgi:dTDP-4-amino-4,6-dideoxygalactose transaminase
LTPQERQMTAIRTGPPTPLAFVDLKAQHAEIAEEVATGMAQVMSDTSFIGGPDVDRFEELWAAYCQAGRAVGVGSGTDALELALRAIGVGVGDEVVVPANSFIASAGAVARIGAVPVFVDCDPRYLLIDPDAIAAAFSPRTRAIMPVHLYGQLAPMERVAEVAAEGGVAVVEDGAQAHGATRHGQLMGSWSLAAATSFYPGKNLGAYGDGGAVTTNSDEVAAALLGLRNHGSVARYQHPILGFNSRLDSLQAVVLAAKLQRLDQWNQARREAAERYTRYLTGVDGVRLPKTADGNEHVWHLFVVRVPERDRCLAGLQARGVPAAIHYPTPIHLTGAFAGAGAGAGHRRGDFPVAEHAAEEILSLPMHPHLTAAQQQYVAEALADVVGEL